MSFGTKLTSSMFALMLVVGFGAGCATKAPVPTATPENVAALAPPAPPRATDEYRIQSGDELHVRFTYQPELNEQIPVRPDGRISLATTGEIVATGLTPIELERVVARKSERRLKNPEVVVVVTKIAEQRVYVVADFTDSEEKRPTLGDSYRVEARVVTWENPQALHAPAGALFQRNGSWQTFVIDGRRARLRTIKVGRSNGVDTEILDGLREGDRLVVYPGDKVFDGTRVAPLVIDPR